MEAESEYLQIRPSATFGTSVRQLEKERITDKVQAAQTKSSELELGKHWSDPDRKRLRQDR